MGIPALEGVRKVIWIFLSTLVTQATLWVGIALFCITVLAGILFNTPAFAIDCHNPPRPNAPNHCTFLGHRIEDGWLVPAYSCQSAFSYWRNQCFTAKTIPKGPKQPQNQDPEEYEEDEGDEYE